MSAPAFDAAEIEQQTMYVIAGAPIRQWPFAHFVVEDALPPAYFATLRAALPPLESYTTITETGRITGTIPEAYKQRYTIDMTRPEAERFPSEHRPFWSGFLGWLLGEGFAMFALGNFGERVTQRFGPRLAEARIYPEFQLLRDFTDYALGPHTDSPHKVVVLLLYLAENDADESLGTSFYVPRDDTFRCDGGPHHPRDRFHRVATMPYRPNTMVGFFKSARSFHGVEPVARPGARRDLIQLSFCHRLGGSGETAPVPRD